MARAICPAAYNGSTGGYGYCSDWAFAGGPDQVLNESFTINLPGGVQYVVIDMVDVNYNVLASETCTRWGCTRTV